MPFPLRARRLFPAIALGSVCLLLPACHRGEAKRARPLVGVSLLTQTHAFYKELEDGLRDEAKKRNLDVAVVACEMDPGKQASQIEDFIAQHVSALLLAPCDSSAVGQDIQSAEAAHIPVFTADIAARSGHVISHVASDNVLGGRLAAKALAGAIGDKGEVVIIDHPTVASVQDRIKGFMDELKSHPGITVVARPSADGQRAKAMAIMEDMLQAHPNLKGVFGINDDCALGALSVLEAAGRKDIAIVGYDATAEAQAAIRRGSALKADVIQYPDKIGRTAIDEIADYLAGKQVPAIVSVDVGVVTADTFNKKP
ncbi:MAG TPA: substrate-binding domain-containing protein [Vicinamibacterales bacterium]|nr:substrate-binding domain-containing protein [Vicinamibacterales bacterium]